MLHNPPVINADGGAPLPLPMSPNTYQTIRNTSVGFSALALLLVAIAIPFAWHSWQAETEHESVYLSTIVQITGNSLDSYFDSHERALAELAREFDGASPLDLERAHRLLRRFRENNPDLVHASLSRPDGRMLALDDRPPGERLPFLGDVDSFRVAVEDLTRGRRINIGRPGRTRVDDQWILPLRFGVRDAAGNLKYVINASLPLSRQQSFWRDLPLPEGSALGLIRDDAYLVSRYPLPAGSDYQDVYGKPRSGALVKYLRQNDFPLRGITSGTNSLAAADDFLFAFHRLGSYPLTVFVSTPVSNVQMKWWRQAQFSLLLLTLLLVGGYAVYHWSVRRQLAWEREREQSDARIEFLAHHDPLTRLPNRLIARDRLDMALAFAERTGGRAALLFLDLDNFKTVNDSLGHPIGDGLLKAVAARLRECIRDTDTLCRQGGDEFLVVLSDVRDPESVTRVAELVLERLASIFRVEGHELATSLSMGIAIYPDDGRDFDTLLKKADTAMYHAKEAGRNAYRFFTEKMNVDADERLRMRHWLRHALDSGGFRLHYQPLIDLASGAVVGAEALLRLEQPEHGLVPPTRFITVAEDSGLIVPIGEWVLREACRQAAAWQQDGLRGLAVAVNLSAVQFKRGDLEADVARALAESGLAPACLELELTESTLIDDTQNVLAMVQRLRGLGVKFAIDDFGTGYSSLAYLKRFSVEKLKIDRSFIHDIVDDPDNAAIVRAVIQMARSLGIRTVAEGIEDSATHDFLRLQHCDEAQGLLFSAPLPAAEFAEWAMARRRLPEATPAGPA